MWTLTPGCFCAFNCCIHFSLRLSYCFCCFLCLLFCACSCPVFFCVSILAKPSTPIFPWGAFLYSGFNFSHYELPFPTRYCIPYVRSGLYQLVIRVKGFRVCALHCVRANNLDFAFLHWNLSSWSPRFERVVLCIASARTTLAVSAVAPS